MTVTVYTKPAVRHEALSSTPEMKGDCLNNGGSGP